LESKIDDRNFTALSFIFHFIEKTQGEQRSMAEMAQAELFFLGTITLAIPPPTDVLPHTRKVLPEN